MKQLIYSLLFMAIGLFSIISSIANWDFFFNSRKAQLFLKLFGRNGARIFYAILGLAIFAIGFLASLKVISLEPNA